MELQSYKYDWEIILEKITSYDLVDYANQTQESQSSVADFSYV